MRTRPHSSAEAGFTLVEIMIASALTVVLGLFIASMLFNSSQQQTRLEDRSNRADFVQSAALDLRMKPIPTPSP